MFHLHSIFLIPPGSAISPLSVLIACPIFLALMMFAYYLFKLELLDQVIGETLNIQIEIEIQVETNLKL